MLIHFKDAERNSTRPARDALRRIDEVSARQERIKVSTAVAVAGLVALTCLVLLGRLIGPPQAGDAPSVATAIEQCRTITDDQSRLGCYDREARASESWPAKGGLAPPLRHDSDRQSQSR
jgi:hypothetical protein